MALLSAAALLDLTQAALSGSGATAAAAASTARALVAAELQGIPSHGAGRAPMYCAHLRNGRVVGSAVPRVVAERGGACLVDAGNGLAFPACDLAIEEVIRRAAAHGVAYAGIANSNHFGMVAHHLEPVAGARMVGIGFGNSPGAMPMPGGRHAVFGTNPIAAVFPRRDAAPISIDLSLSEVARGKLMVAAREGRRIPEGWALDADGNPTTDPAVGLQGMMVPMGGAKGAMLALIIELLSVALTGSAFAWQADTFFQETGNQARLGQGFLVIDPGALAGHEMFTARVEMLVDMLLADPDVRLPGARRYALQRENETRGVDVPDSVLDQLRALALATSLATSMPTSVPPSTP